MKRLFLRAAFAMLLVPAVVGAQTELSSQTTQTVRGQVCDVASGEPMIGVTITVENGTTMGTVSDADGNFVINNVPVGRHSVRATYIGYEPVLLKEQLVSSGKELVLSLRMRESISELGEVVEASAMPNAFEHCRAGAGSTAGQQVNASPPPSSLY